jgi:hypothetical protein
MKHSVFGEYENFTIVDLRRTHLGKRLMKLGALGEHGE